MSADYEMGVECLQENLSILSDGFGNVKPENLPLFNLSNALLVILDALKASEARLQSVEHLLQGLSAQR